MSAANFAQALATYEMAQSDLEGLGDDYSNEECDLLADASLTALAALLLAKAPNLAALAFKMEAFAAEDCHGLAPNMRDPLWAALIADVGRLAAAAH